MTGKRSMPHSWWARRDTLLAAGGTALAVWLVAGAWMLFAPAGRDAQPLSPDRDSSVLVRPTPNTSSTGSGYDPGVYTGPLNTPTFSPHPHRTPTATGSPSGSATGGGPTGPGPTSEPTTTGPGNGHGNGNGHGHKP
jgi:hypothetical protein